MPVKPRATFSSSFMRSPKFSALMLRAPGREALMASTTRDDDGFHRCRLDIIMVLLGSQSHGFRRTVFAQHLAADVVVLAFHFVRQGFAEVVDEGGVLGGFDVGAKLFGDDAGDVRHFGGVLEHVLAVAGAVT